MFGTLLICVCMVVGPSYAANSCDDVNSLDMCRKDTYRNPRNCKCIPKKEIISAKPEECKEWVDNGYCMIESLFHEITVANCKQCNPQLKTSTPKFCSNMKAECRTILGACRLQAFMKSIILREDCSLYCLCVSSAYSEQRIVPVKVNSNKCGLVSFNNDKRRIVGGSNSFLGKRPYQLSVQYGTNKKVATHRCGGSLISKKVGLTAAHCFVPGKISSYFASAGQLQKYPPKARIHVSALKKITIHEDYNKVTMANDIAIFVLTEPVQYTNYIRPVCLCHTPPSKSEIFQVSGWGETKSDDKVKKNILQEVDLPVIEAATCNSEKYKTFNRIKPGMICAGYDEGRKDACQGDSGGPAVVVRGGKLTLCGIVSWGFGCAGRNSPGVYAEVSYYISWIMKNMTEDLWD